MTVDLLRCHRSQANDFKAFIHRRTAPIIRPAALRAGLAALHISAELDYR